MRYTGLTDIPAFDKSDNAEAFKELFDMFVANDKARRLFESRTDTYTNGYSFHDLSLLETPHMPYVAIRLRSVDIGEVRKHMEGDWRDNVKFHEI